MMDSLIDRIKEYKNCSLEILKCIENEDFKLLDSIFDKRAEIIDEIKKINYSKDEFASCCKEYEIVEIEKDIDEKMNFKRTELLGKMKNVSKAKNANNSYNKIYNTSAYFFNKKI